MTVIQRLELLAEDVEKLGEGGGGDLSAYLTKDEASSTYETQTSAAATYETQAHASSTYLAKNANPLVIATYTNPTEDTNDGTDNIYLGSLTNSTADSRNNISIGYNVDVKPKTQRSVAIGYNTKITYAGNSIGSNSVAINGKVYGQKSVAIQGIVGRDTNAYGSNNIAILGEINNFGENLTSLNSTIQGNLKRDWCTAVNAGKSGRLITECQNSVYIGQLRDSITDCSGCVGIGTKYFNKNVQTYNNVISIGNDLLPSTSNCVILGSFSEDMRTSGSFFVVGNGTNDSNRSNLVEITTPFTVSTDGIEVNGVPFAPSVSDSMYSSTTLVPLEVGIPTSCDVPWSHIMKENDFTLLKTVNDTTYAVRFQYSQTTGRNSFMYKGSLVLPSGSYLHTYIVEMSPAANQEDPTSTVSLIGTFETALAS